MAESDDKLATGEKHPDDQPEILAFDNMYDRGPRANTAWTRYEIKMAVPIGAKNINFGALHSCDGTAWFDSLQVEIDGKPYTDKWRISR